MEIELQKLDDIRPYENNAFLLSRPNNVGYQTSV